MTASIIEYLGLANDGVLVLINLIKEDKNYDAIFYYDSKDILLTISEEMEKEIGHKIEDDENYIKILKEILNSIAPYNEIKGKLKQVTLL